MSFNLLDSVKSFLSPALISKAAGFLGESESAVQKGMDVALPVSLAGIIDKAESAPESLLSLAREANKSGILGNLAGAFSSGGGGIPAMAPGLISSVFGDKFGKVANQLSSFTGLKGSTVSSIFGSLVPLALAFVGKHATDNNLSPGGLSSLLSSQKKSVLSALPAGFSIAGLFAPAKATVEAVKKPTNWTIPIILAVVAIALFWYLMKGCNKEATPVSATPDTVVQARTDTAAAVVNSGPVKLRLPDGVEIDAYKGGIEDMLITFLNDPNATPGKDVWFDFNELNFKFGTAEIVPESMKQLANIEAILKAYPKAKIKIGGYTDKVGDEGTNKKLSQGRADAVSAAIKTAGFGSQVTGSEGYGSEFAKFPADAPEADRIKDRRVSVSVREK